MRNERGNADEGKIIHQIVWLIWASCLVLGKLYKYCANQTAYFNVCHYMIPTG